MFSNRLTALIYSSFSPTGHLSDIMTVITFAAVKFNGVLLDVGFFGLVKASLSEVHI